MDLAASAVGGMLTSTKITFWWLSFGLELKDDSWFTVLTITCVA